MDGEENLRELERSRSFDRVRKRTCGYIAKNQLKKAKGQLEKAKGNIKNAASKTQLRVKKEMKKTVAKIMPHVRKAVTGDEKTRIRDHMKKTPVVKFVDKLSFFFGVNVLVFSEFVLLKRPDLLWLLFLAVCPTLIAIRAPMYYKNKWQYFILDFCYFVNFCYVVCIGTHILDMSRTRYVLDSLGFGDIHLWNAWFLRLNFAMATGPLVCAIWVWRNSAVFHSLDKMTSWYIHWLPAVLAFCQRWYTNFLPLSLPPSLAGSSSIGFVMCHDSDLDEADVSSIHHKASKDWSDLPECTASVSDWFVYPMVAYLVWQTAYLVTTEFVMAEQIKNDTQIQTSVRWLTSDSKNGFNKLCTSACRAIGVIDPVEKWNANEFKTKVVFVLVQLFYTMVTFLPVKLCYEYYYVHIFVLWVTFLKVIWNGAAFYIEVFAVRYIRKFPATPPGSPKLKGQTAKMPPPSGNGIPQPGDGTY